MTNFETTPIYADAASRVTDGTAGGTSAGTGVPVGSRMVVGTNVGVNGYHALLRFLTNTIPTAETVVKSRVRVESAVANTPGSGVNFQLWASDLGAAVNESDYNLPSSNTTVAGQLRVPLQTVFTGGIPLAVNTMVETVVPSRFIGKGAGAVSDFELRPDVTTMPTVSQTATIYGPAETTEVARKPRLIGLSYTDAELTRQNPYRPPAIASESWTAFGMEGVPGTPVKANTFLEMSSSTLDSQAENLVSEAQNRQRSRPRKMAVGRSGASGEVDVEFTPQRWTALLRGMMKIQSSTGPTNGVYTTILTNCRSDEVAYFTFVQRNGMLRQVFPGTIVGGITVNAALDQKITGSISVMARDEYLYDQEGAGGSDDPYLLDPGAAYDTVDNGVLSFVGALITFDNGLSDGRLVRNATLTMGQNPIERRGLNRQRGVDGHYPGAFNVEVSFEMTFENEKQIRKFLGVASAGFPVAAEKTLQFQSVSLSFEGTLGVAKQEIRFDMTKVSYTTVRKPISGDGEVTLQCTGMAVYDESVGSNLKATIVSAEDPAILFAPRTNLITVLPAGK